MFRTDPEGLHALTVDASGGVWPGPHFVGREGFNLGTLGVGQPLDEAGLRRFEDVGALTTAACIPCWARGLCGGGSIAVHQTLSGSFRMPHEPWCDAQRSWMEGAVAEFNTLSSAGVDFTRVYESLGRTGRPSLWMMAKMAKTALQLRVLMRPIEEADADLLTRWENWNEAAYFTFHESGLLLATRYDREMDALHPRSYEQEFMITDRGGAPMGLIKIRPDRLAGLASAWLYLRKEGDYANDGVRTALRLLLREALKGRGIRRIIAPAGPNEEALATCLQAIGFQAVGVARAALYLHGKYHDMRLFVCEAEAE
jgi:radical SAM protein with 4Fe4S-binding SPASM domain